jgi:hypothetical protein
MAPEAAPFPYLFEQTAGEERLLARRGIVGAVVLLVLALGVALALTLGGDDDGEESPVVESTATPRPEVEASDVVQSFVEALATDDTDTLYAIQAEEYKRICSRDEFESFAAQLQTSPLEGPAQFIAGHCGGRRGAGVALRGPGRRYPPAGVHPIGAGGQRRLARRPPSTTGAAARRLIEASSSCISTSLAATLRRY